MNRLEPLPDHEQNITDLLREEGEQGKISPLTVQQIQASAAKEPAQSAASYGTSPGTTGSLPSSGGQKPKFPHNLMDWWHDRSRQQQILIGVAAVVVLLGGGTGVFVLTHKPAPKPAVVVQKPKPVPPKPTIEPSKLTGLPVKIGVNQRPVTAVMIENSIWARPQSSLASAGVVFEAIAEGGITRFLALYQDTQPGYIGPVRSARPYYVQWAMGFNAGYAHVGGSPQALQDIKRWHVRDLDQFFNAGAYHRIASREAPHNMYTSMAALNQLEKSKGYTTSTYTGFARKPKDTPKVTPVISSIDMAISGYYYNVHYTYDKTTNSYKRFEGGEPHMDVDGAGKKVQNSPKVVIAMVMQYGLEADDHHSKYNVIGSGRAYIFQDGTIIPATWKKASPTSQLAFVDAAGNPIALNPGQTWLTALSASSQLTYK